jgi:homoserine acetyltransferase
MPVEQIPEEGILDKEALAKSLALAALARSVEAGESGNAGLAQRAAKPVSALEAARNAAAAEARQRQEVQQKQANALPRQVEKLLSRKLPGVQRLEVVNALIMDDREVLKALWKAHRTRMAQHGVLGMVVAATSVLRALEAVPKGQLVAAIAATEISEFLVWVDIGSEATIAAFPDARTWITRS